ncbi:cysteine synthase [Candidatus Methanoplasma termitum]|uniref:Cysteine synthase n=1 Tax=Candidatus Methanoplasma termitum TaxID=1577791 RepID=A0A0A7LAL9_9ARCH|nr:cysteine synthase family protein [Candidatus Methanoplasma termitum]AIZ56200.1 cysteine synthase [Candidatus Methanoplasma termitum]
MTAPTSKDILGLIGNTPLVRINNMVDKKGVEIWAKLEGFNPTGSIKDRTAMSMINAAIRDGRLTKGKTIIEATSGNTGISLAMIGRVLGFEVVIVMSEAVSIERQKMIKAFGGQIILTPAAEGTDGAIRKTRQLVKGDPDKYFNPDQFSNDFNPIAHYEGTAEEIWQQTKGKITHIVCALGTSGTIMGVGESLRRKNPNIKIIEAQPIKGHYIQGLKNMQEAIVPAIYYPELIDEHVMIESEEAFEISRQIALKEGILVGMSAGAAMLAAMKVSEKIDKGLIVAIFADRGEKYLSTDLFKV